MAYGLMACDPLQHRSMYQREDSEDSDGEGGLGNVSRVLIRPPGTTGKAKKGHLCFDASFESGNLGRIDLISEFEYDLFIRPDTCSPRFRMWFNFTVDNYKLDQRVVFNIVNISKSKTVFRDYLTPIVKSTTRPHWQRIPREYVWYHRSPAHQGHPVLSFAFTFDRDDEVFQFAMTAPYSYSRLQTYLLNLEKRAASLINDNLFHRETIGNSVQNRKVDVLTIGRMPETPLEKKRVVVILARVHPGESPASFVCQGVMDFMTSNNYLASFLREHIIFKIVPMLNPDGVFLGNYKSTLMGFDLNRSWHIASPWAHPTLWAVLQMLKEVDSNEFFQLDFVIDLHAHTSLTGCFIYGNTYEDIYRYERHIVFPKLLGNNADDYVQSNTMFNTDVQKVGTARRHLCTVLSDYVNCYTLEVSFGGYSMQQSSSPGIIIPYTKQSYFRVGCNLCRTFIDYYKLIGVFADDIPKQLHLSRKNRRGHSQRYKSRSPLSPKSRSKSMQRYAAEIHYTDIFGSEFEDDSDYYPNSFIKRSHCDHKRLSFSHIQKTNASASERITKCVTKSSAPSQAPVSSVSIPVFTYVAPPKLSIIDFNQLTRGGLDRAVDKRSSKKTIVKESSHSKIRFKRFSSVGKYL